MPTLHVQNKGSIEIYYEARGEGPPVILIGGLTSTAAVWGLQIPALASRYQVITPDNRGSGRTRLTSDDGVRTPARFAGDVLALIDGLELDRVHLAGASMGGNDCSGIRTASRRSLEKPDHHVFDLRRGTRHPPDARGHLRHGCRLWR